MIKILLELFLFYFSLHFVAYNVIIFLLKTVWEYLQMKNVWGSNWREIYNVRIMRKKNINVFEDRDKCYY